MATDDDRFTVSFDPLDQSLGVYVNDNGVAFARTSTLENGERLCRMLKTQEALLKSLKSAVGGVGYLARASGIKVAEWEAWEREARDIIAKATTD